MVIIFARQLTSLEQQRPASNYLVRYILFFVIFVNYPLSLIKCFRYIMYLAFIRINSCPNAFINSLALQFQKHVTFHFLNYHKANNPHKYFFLNLIIKCNYGVLELDLSKENSLFIL